MNIKAIKSTLEFEEGRVRYAYPDHKGYLTIGVGHLVDVRRGGLPDEIIDLLLEYDLDEAVTDLGRTIPNWTVLPDNVQEALVYMRFQLGLRGLGGFVLMLAAIAREDWHTASDEALNSKWARDDTPERAARVAALMRGD